jgi:5-methylcytosine-specific restriction endonuclease McrA
VLKLEGTTSAIEELRARIELRERQLWEADGGRDLKPGEHRRTREQRLFDAAQDILLGTTAAAQTSGRPAVVLNIDASNPEAAAEMVGVGPIPDTVAAEILARANIFINIHDIDRKTLWWGRLKRRASLTQFIALAARDKGCVLCGTHWLRCEVHHLTPWNSPAKGETNIDDLALTCSTCHHDTHAAELTIVRGPHSTWTTRPALAHEIAPKRPQRPACQHRGERPITIVDNQPKNCEGKENSEHQMPTKKPSEPESSDDEAA